MLGSGSPRGGGREAGRSGRWRHPACATGKASSPGLPAGWAGASKHREYGLHRICVNPFWSLDAIVFIMAASGFYQNEMNQWRDGQQHQLPPRVPPPPWELRPGGMPGGWGVQGGGGRRGVLAYPVLCSLLGAVRSFHLTDRVDCALVGAHNLTASASNTGLHPVLRSVFLPAGGIRRTQET